MKIRRGKIQDKDSIRKLVEMMIGDEDKEIVSNNVVEDLFKLEHFNIFVMETMNGISGYIVIKTNPFDGGGELGEIVFLGVDENSRNLGYGIELVKFVEDFARKENIRKLYVKTNPHNKKAVCFWINRDYQFEARMKDFSKLNIDDYYLGKEL
ncbi:MAG: GNAT family N-acetyltransferase [Clostridiales bacterium]|nr:GNAT family N-acetyltransferase [Clostridiales bacterium]